MVSISKPQSAKQAESYYAKENYYQQNSELGLYHGSDLALNFFGLKRGQEIGKDDYKKMLAGIHPGSGKKLYKNSGKEDRRAGIDVTFSAPKSVSLAMELATGSRHNSLAEAIRQAHNLASREAMQRVVDRLAKTRVYINKKGKQIEVKADIVFAEFQHDTTRITEAGEIDPQLHNHNFIFSSAVYRDRKTGKMKALALHNDEIFKAKMYLGQTYRNQLAAELTKLGFEIEVTDFKQGLFEIKGFDRQTIEAFSGRRGELTEKLDALIKDGAIRKDANRSAALNVVNEKTKKSKTKVDREKVTQKNKERLRERGFDNKWLNKLVDELKLNQKIEKEPTSRDFLKDIALKALRVREEQDSVFRYEDFARDMMRVGLEYGIEERDFEPVLNELLAEGGLIRFDQNAYSTKAIYDSEKFVIETINKRKGSEKPLLHDTTPVKEFIGERYSNMNEGQRGMVEAVLTTTDRYIAVQGDAGTGKTYSMEAIKNFTDTQDFGYEMVGLSFTGKAADQLQKDSGIPSRTLHSFIYAEQKRKDSPEKPRLIIVDEAGMKGSVQTAELMKIAEKNGDRIVFVGDTKQFSSISAGDMFADMQKYGARPIELKDVMRQKTQHTKEIVGLIKEQKIPKALEILENRGEYLEGDREDVYRDVAREYLQESGERDLVGGQMVICSRNADKSKINDLIRSGLQKEGDEFTVWESKSDSSISRYYTHNLKEGMIAVPQKATKGLGLKAGQTYRIKEILDRHNVTIVNEKSGKEITVDLYRDNNGEHISFFAETQKSFAEGEVIMFNKNGKDLDGKPVKNGERTVIRSISPDGVIETENGKKIDMKSYPFIDYGYAITDVKSQGATVDKVLVFADPGMANIKSFYTQMTRMKYDVKLWTTNKEELRANIEKQKQKLTTLSFKNPPQKRKINLKSAPAIEKIEGAAQGLNNLAAASEPQIRKRHSDKIYQRRRKENERSRNKSTATSREYGAARNRQALSKSGRGREGVTKKPNRRGRLPELSFGRLENFDGQNEREFVELLLQGLDGRDIQGAGRRNNFGVRREEYSFGSHSAQRAPGRRGRRVTRQQKQTVTRRRATETVKTEGARYDRQR